MSKLLLVASLAAVIMVAAGCSDDPAGSIEMATVVIDPTPGNAPVTWRLEGVSSASGSGSRSLSVYPGRYVMRWMTNDAWINITGEEYVYLDVRAGETFRIESTFFEDAPATVVVDVTPDDTPSEWFVTAADGTVTSGVGDAQFQIDHSGPVTMIWQGTGTLWPPMPSEVEQTALGNTVTFAGEFLPRIDDPVGRGVCLPSGSFMMGSPLDEQGRENDETPHEVTIAHRFFCDRNEVDIRDYLDRAVQATLTGSARMEIFTTSMHFDTFRDTLIYTNNANISVITNYSPNASDGTPVALIHIFDALDGNTGLLMSGTPPNTSVNRDAMSGEVPLNYTGNLSQAALANLPWFAAAAYCDWLSLEEGFERAYDHATWSIVGGDPQACEGYRLPTEAEWEYACRAGTRTAFCSGPILVTTVGDVNLDRVAWYGGAGLVRASGLKLPNDFGLYDMHGNAREWCQDWYAFGAYETNEPVDPTGPAEGRLRCVRGGNVDSYSRQCRSANRQGYDPYLQGPNGFRVVRSLID